MASRTLSTAVRLTPISRATFASSSRSSRIFPAVRTFSTQSNRSPSGRQGSTPIPVSVLKFRRAASTASAGSALSPSDFDTPPLPSKPRIAVTPPSLEAIKEEGYLEDDVELIPADQAHLNITPDAVQQLVAITSREPPQVLSQGKLALRVGVESGGCHGYQYTMALTEERGVDDYILQPEGLQCIPVVIDIVSFGLLKGATLHFATELIGSSFRLQDNPQAKEGGACGCGVSWEAK
ncbi:hypothetical protein IAU60_000046 [Kwoniella sp. DSM 27419]